MPSGTINGQTNNVNVLIKVDWSESNVNVANNTSDVTAVIQMCRNDRDTLYWTRGTASLDVSIGGLTEHVDQYVSLTYSYGWVTVKSITKTVPHDSNGAKNCAITISGSILDTSVSSITLNGTAVLTTIARASQPTATDTSFGSATTITTNRVSTAFTHTIVITFGSSHSQTITGVGASTTWTVPASWADGIPGQLSGTFGVTCNTYNGSTLIGQKTTTFTVTIPDSWKPTVSISASYTNIGSNSKVLANVTRVTLTASATPTTGANLSSYAWSRSASGTAATYTHIPSSTGTYNYTVTVTDSRGRTNSATFSVTVYSPVSSFTCDSSVNFGSALTVSIGRMKSTFTHVVRYYINSSHTHDENDNNHAWTEYTIPASWAEVVPTTSSTTMTVTCYTYNGDTNLGSTSKTVTVVVPSTWLPDFTLTAEAVSAFNSLYLKGVSKIKLTASSATPSAGSQIQSYQFTGNNLNKTASTTATSYNATSELLSVVGSNTYTVKVTDKRGRVKTKTTSITVTDYSAPTLRLTVGRYDSGGTADTIGAYGRITATGTWSAVTGNSWTLTLKQKKKTASSYTTVNTYSNQTTATISKTSSLFSADIDSVYDCQGVLTDAVGKSVTVTVAISTGMALMDLYKDKVATFFSTASETLRNSFSNPASLFYSAAGLSAFNGLIAVPAKGYDGMTNGFTYLHRAMLNRSDISYSDFNSYTESGMYWINPTTTPTNNPTAGYGFLEVLAIRDGVILQKFTPYNTSNGYLAYTRAYTNSQWYNWANNRELPNQLNIRYGTDIKLSLYGNTEGGNIREYAPDGSYVEMDQYNSSTWRLYSANSSGSYQAALTWDKATDVNLSNVWTSSNALCTHAKTSNSVSVPSGTVTNIATVSPGKAGRYQINCDVNFASGAEAITILYIARLNSSNTVQEERYIRNSMNAGGGFCLSLIYVLDATDKIRFRVYQGSSAAATARYNYSYMNLRTT